MDFFPILELINYFFYQGILSKKMIYMDSHNLCPVSCYCSGHRSWEYLHKDDNEYLSAYFQYQPRIGKLGHFCLGAWRPCCGSPSLLLTRQHLHTSQGHIGQGHELSQGHVCQLCVGSGLLFTRQHFSRSCRLRLFRPQLY